MKRPNPNPGNIIDRAVDEIRGSSMTAEEMERSGSRVRAMLQTVQQKVRPLPERIDGCADFQALLPAYRLSSLSPSRRTLLEDHLADCAVCRKALEGAPPEYAESAVSHSRFRITLFGTIAAILLVALALTQISALRNLINPLEVYAMTQAVDGSLYSVTGQEIHPVTAGQRIGNQQSVRTGIRSGAVLELPDGSRIEMAERSELALNRAADGIRIELQRGNVIVTAAKQHHGHLYVSTPDCNVSVVGTVFSVASSTKGSRVSVIEGVVQVEHGESTQSVQPGQQVTTNPSVASVSIQQDIQWSRDLSRHLALLNEFVGVTKDIDQKIGGSSMRYTSDLVPLVPAGTLVLGSIPNVPQSIPDSYKLFKTRIDENSILQRWWAENGRGPDDRFDSLDGIMAQVARVSEYLGSEVVIAGPDLVLADAVRRDELIAALGGASVTPAPNVVIRVDGGLMVAAVNADQIQKVLDYRDRPGTNTFPSSALYQRLEQAYREGVGWLLAADLQRMNVASTHDAEEAQFDVNLGLSDADLLVVEQKTGAGGAAYQATLGFKDVRKGVASWMGAPSTIGALEFVSAGAYSVATAVTKDATQILDDVTGMFANDSRVWSKLHEFEEKNRVDLRMDVAQQLGNEFLFALDGPLLPAPSWKIVIEVNDAARLQNALQTSVNELNRAAVNEQKPGITLTTETSGGLTFYTMKSPDFPGELHYTFWAGYLIVTPNRTLLTEAIQYRNTGTSLARSPGFRAQLPGDGRDEVSGIVYYNLKALTQSIPVDSLQDLSLNFPTLVCLYGLPNRIVMSSKGVLGTNVASADMLESMTRATRR